MSSNGSNPNLEAALAYAATGQPVFPLWGPTVPDPEPDDLKTRTLIEYQHAKGKSPLERHAPHGKDDATVDVNRITDWWTIRPQSAIGLRCDNLLVLDPDNEQGMRRLAELEAEHGKLPETLTARTPGGGRHLVFRLPDGVELGNRDVPLGDSINLHVRAGTNGYIVVAPSGTKLGPYKWETRAKKLPPIASAPAWLIELLTGPPLPSNNSSTNSITSASASISTSTTGTSAYGRAALEAETRKVAGAAEGSRNNILNTAALRLGQLVAGGELAEADVRTELVAAAEACGLPGGEAQKTITSGLQAGLTQPRSKPEANVKVAPVDASGDAAPADSFEARVLVTKVDLIERIRQGIPPIDYLPASTGMLVRGKRHQIAAPRKEGKSIAMLVHWVVMAQAGAIVVILDRENGADLYAHRLEAIIAALGISEDEQEQLAARLRYYEFPRLRLDDQHNLVELCEGADIVVFDAQRMFLTDLGLREDQADDYATFVAATIDPLFRAGIAAAILDNTGHEDATRARGSSSKGDLNEVLFKLKAVKRFDLHTEGIVQLSVTETRFGNRGTWKMRIGGGTFEPWQVAEGETGADWRPTNLMERASRVLENLTEPIGKTDLSDSFSGHKPWRLQAVGFLLTDGYATIRDGGIASVKPYREPDTDVLTEDNNI